MRVLRLWSVLLLLTSLLSQLPLWHRKMIKGQYYL